MFFDGLAWKLLYYVNKFTYNIYLSDTKQLYILSITVYILK